MKSMINIWFVSRTYYFLFPPDDENLPNNWPIF